MSTLASALDCPPHHTMPPLPLVIAGDGDPVAERVSAADAPLRVPRQELHQARPDARHTPTPTPQALPQGALYNKAETASFPPLLPPLLPPLPPFFLSLSSPPLTPPCPIPPLPRTSRTPPSPDPPPRVAPQARPAAPPSLPAGCTTCPSSCSAWPRHWSRGQGVVGRPRCPAIWGDCGLGPGTGPARAAIPPMGPRCACLEF